MHLPSLQAILPATLIAAAALSSLAPVQASLAATDTETPTQLVRFGDLQLDTDAGIVVLYSRLANAAHQVCAPLKGMGIEAHFRHHNCVEAAMSRAIAQIGNPSLSAYCANKNARSTATFAER